MAVDLDQWSREELEAEARRRGISGYATMTRSELLRALLSGRRGGGLLGTLFGKVVERVREVLPGAATSSRPPPPPAPSSPPPRPDTPAKKAPPEGEPILTRTMAGVLAAQGHHARALAIYDHLLASAPDDARLREERRALADEMARDAPSPADAIAMVALAGGRLLVSWDVDDDALARARSVAGEDGALVVRVVVIAPDGNADVTTNVREQAGVSARGEWVLEGLPADARMTASVGIQASSRFVSAAHTRVVRL